MLGVSRLPTGTFHTWDSIPTEFYGISSICFQGRHPASRRGSLASDHGSCLLPLTLSFLLRRTTRPFGHASRVVLDFPSWATAPADPQRSRPIHGIRNGCSSLFLTRMRSRMTSMACFASFSTIGGASTSLTHSSNVRSFDRLCSPSTSLRTGGVRRHSASQVVVCFRSGRTLHTLLTA